MSAFNVFQEQKELLERLVDDFAEEMKAKLIAKSLQGWNGWETCPIEDLENGLNILKNKTIEETTRLVGKGRVEFMEVGTYIYKMFFDVLGKNTSIVLDDGLREGVAIDCALKMSGKA